ncbi:MAG: TonB family protein [Gemmatimonadota bacterium]
MGLRVQQSSGYPALDRAAKEVAAEMRFSPAMNRDRKTAVWVQQAIEFEVR